MKKLISKLKDKKVLRKLIMIVAVIIIVGGFYYWQVKKDRIAIDNSLINASIISIAPTTGGRLLEMDVQEGKSVKKGDLIAVVGGEAIRSTVDGLVVMASNQIGGSFGPQNPVAQLIDTNQMRVSGTIDENKGLNNLRVGQVASFTVDAYPGKTYWGFVDEISTTALQTQLSFSISNERPTQQFQVFVRFPAGRYPELKNGMSAKLTVFTATK